MAYRIDKIDLFLRETPPGRFGVALGKRAKIGEAPKPDRNPIGHVRMIVRDDRGRSAFGCAGDRLSVRWLDKRPGRSKGRKLRDLVGLIEKARDIHLAEPRFDTPFEKWLAAHPRVQEAGRSTGQESLTSSFASALMERALLDAVSRLEGRSLFAMVAEDRLGVRPERVHPELKGFRYRNHLPARPVTEFTIRHTVGWRDPLTADDVPGGRRLNDGLPETLEEYVRRDSIHYFKVKISGDPDADLRRLGRIRNVIPLVARTALTLDANEAYEDLEVFESFVRRLEREQTGLFQHTLYIEQPLPRALSLDPKAGPAIRRVGKLKPVIIDEADGTVDAFRRARAMGYAGTSHKNCKGFFKSLLNGALAARDALEGRNSFLSGEDLQNLPIVPLHQDFVSLSILGLRHCERNGHHYNYGLSMLPVREKVSVARHHGDLYVRRGDDWFMDIRNGRVSCASLQCPGYGVREEPHWATMTGMREWVEAKHPE